MQEEDLYILWTHDEEGEEVRGRWWESEENGEVDCAEEIDKFSATCPFAMCECVCLFVFGAISYFRRTIAK